MTAVSVPARAVVFPGQGSQVPQMAVPWRDHPAFERWAEADQLLGRNITRLGLEADADELREPVNCQLALFVHHIALLDAWRAATGATPIATAGHSLGEYDALFAAGILSFADGLRLVDVRARETQAAADAAPGTMAACLGYDVEAVRQACDKAGAHVANDNAPGQIVVAGSATALDEVEAVLASVEGSRGKVRRLEVGAAYHSPHMEAAVAPFTQAVRQAAFADAAFPVVANVDARAHRDSGDWLLLLPQQLTAPVRWRESVGTLAELGVEQVVELGATPVLTGMVKRIDPNLDRVAVSTPEDLP